MFSFKQFEIEQSTLVFPVTTDALLLGAFARICKHGKALEVGTGTGIVSMMLAQRFPGVAITALDINPNAAALAKRNFEGCSFSSRLSVTAEDFRVRAFESSFDDVLSNPPYFKNGLKSLSYENAKHQGTLSGESLVVNSVKNLKPEGRLHLILPASEMLKTREICRIHGLNCTRSILIRHNPKTSFKRVLLEFTNARGLKCDEGEFTVREISGDFTAAYKKLMREFHPFL